MAENLVQTLEQAGIFKTVAEVTQTVGQGAFITQYALNPTWKTAIFVQKAAETITVKVTGSSANPLVAGSPWITKSNDTVDYDAGDTAGLTGVEISGTPGAASITYQIIQYKPK